MQPYEKYIIGKKERRQKEMKKVYKRLLSVLLALVMVVGVIPVSAVSTNAATISKNQRIYFDTNDVSNFTLDSAVPSVLFKDGKDSTNGTWVLMKKVVGSDTLYYADADRDNVTHVQFRRSSSANADWNSGTVILELQEGKNCFKISSWDKTNWSNTGDWSAYGDTSASTESTFYVSTDLVDYYNNHRVGNDDSDTYRYDNQGSWTTAKNNNAPYSSLNKWISGLEGYATALIADNDDEERTIYWNNGERSGDVYIVYWGDGINNTFEKMTQVSTDSPYYQVDIPTAATSCIFTADESYNKKLTGNLTLGTQNLYVYNSGWSFYGKISAPIPLYFGDLFHRVQLTGDQNGSVNNFYRGANVSLKSVNAVAQGIVGDHLVNGQLVTSYDDSVLVPFFEEGAYTYQDDYMIFYNDLQFPFKATTVNGVTTYSFNSKEQTVYYDYESEQIKSSDAEIKDTKGTRGYFPFNETQPDDNAKLNYGFGTKFTIPFTVSSTGYDKNGQAITFNFTGDDDVWVYIDDALVLDMGGAHELASGTINFATRTATVTSGSADAATDYDVYGGNSEFTSNGKETVSFENITVKLSNGDSTTLEEYIAKDSTVHTLTMYYMERGMHNSNMSVSFSFVPLPSGLSLSKIVNTANVNEGLKTAVSTADSFDFTILTKDLKTEDSTYGTVANLGYTLMDYNDNAAPGQVATNSVVKGLNSANFANDFINRSTKQDAFYAGTGFRITETIPTNSVLTYDSEKTAWAVYSAAAVDSLVASGTGLTAEFTMGDKNSSTYAVYNRYVNFINTPEVGNVSLTKTLDGTTSETLSFDFQVQVDLDGEGTKYGYATYPLVYTNDKGTAADTADDVTGTLTDGELTMAPNETVTFSGIPANAKIKATEIVSDDAQWKPETETQEITVSKDSTVNITFVNKKEVGSVSLTKAWSVGTPPTGTAYEFEVSVDGVKSALPYTSDNATANDTSDDKTDTLTSEGKVQLKAGETITFTGLKVGSKVKATETPASGTGWEVDGVSSKDVTVTAGTTQNITIKNKSIINKVIYIEARENSTASPDASTTYTVKDSSDTDEDNKVTVTTFKTTDLPSGTTATSNEEDGSVTYKTSDAGDTGITVSVNDDGSIVFKTENAGKQYVIPYTGTKDNTTVNGEITVFTYKATQKVYVFDYGLKSDLTATNDNKDGLFEGGVFYNTNATGDNTTTATFSGVTGVDNSQTTIAAESGVTVTINENGSSAGSVFFTPVAFMDTAENYTYTANIVKKDATFNSADPETGTVVNGTIKVMPASVVYYEDNFGAIDTSESAEGSLIVNNTAINLILQSNDQSELYGYDDVYSNSTGDSANGSTGMKVGAQASFTFKGTGFDLIARTSDTSGAIVYKVKDTAKNEVKYYGAVDTYYNNGTLYQLPVLSVKNMDYSTYEVTILVIQNSVSAQTMTFYLDGVRIYDPAGDDLNSNYIVEEAGADIKDIRQMILGNCEITENGVVDSTGEIITSAKVENSTASVLYYSDPDLYFYGFMNQEDMKDKTATYAASLAEYLRRGPANEVYLSGDSGVAFVVKADGTANPTFQVEAKAVALGATNTQSDLELQMLDNNKTLKKVSTISTNTAMYYDINVTKGISLGSGYYLVVLVSNASATGCISLTNLKTKGYAISSPTDSSNETLVKDVIGKMTPIFDEDEDLPYSVEVTFVKYENTLLKGREVKAIVSVPEGSEIAGFQVYGNGNSLTTRTEELTTTADGKTQYRVAFMMPSTKGTYTLKFVPYKLGTDGVTPVYSAAYMSKTATLR